MTKKTIRTQLDFTDWTEQFDGKTVGQAIEWLSRIRKDVVMEIYHDYDNHLGEFYEVRLETDEEEAARLAQEASEQRQREESQRKAQEQLDERMMLIAAKDVAFKAYMEKHRDNTNIGDLSNLFMAVMNLTKAGAAANVTGPLLECMARLENI